MRTALGYTALLEYDNEIRVVDGAQAVCYEDRSSLLLFQDGIDVRK
jgi:hypothetical protein